MMFRPALAAVAALLLTSACVSQPGVGRSVAAPEAPPAEQIYMSRMDGSFAIPAVPLERLPPHLRRQTVPYPNTEAPGTIIIHPGEKFLYFTTGPRTAIRYGISVGRAGFEWAGEADVTTTRAWPTWTPPPEMIERDPKLARWEKGQPGGPTNPLGARAIYLTTNGKDYGYRIHGTPEWWSIGRNASSGCIRMINQDVLDLAQRVTSGTKVIVLKADGTRANRLIVPPPAPRKKKPEAEAQPVAAPAVVPAGPAYGAGPVYGTLPPGLTAPAPAAPAPAVPAPAAEAATN